MAGWGHSNPDDRKKVLKFVLLRDHAPVSETPILDHRMFQTLGDAALGVSVLGGDVARVVLPNDDIGAVACVPANAELPVNTLRLGNNAGSKIEEKTPVRSSCVGRFVVENDSAEQHRRRYDGIVLWEVEAPLGPPERSADLSGTFALVSRTTQRLDRIRRGSITLRGVYVAV
jgi:hypothetical protein